MDYDHTNSVKWVCGVERIQVCLYFQKWLLISTHRRLQFPLSTNTFQHKKSQFSFSIYTDVLLVKKIFFDIPNCIIFTLDIPESPSISDIHDFNAGHRKLNLVYIWSSILIKVPCMCIRCITCELGFKNVVIKIGCIIFRNKHTKIKTMHPGWCLKRKFHYQFLSHSSY